MPFNIIFFFPPELVASVPTPWLRVLHRKALGRLWRGPGSPQTPEEQVLGVCDIWSKLPSLAAQLREEMGFPIKAFQVPVCIFITV